MGTKERREREERSRLAAILVAAENVFAARGYHDARMDDIAEAAELAKGTLYYYFKSKDEIYLHLLERESRKVHEEVRRRISGSSTFIEVLEQAFAFYLQYFDRNRAFLKMFLPCMCGLVKLEPADGVRRSTKTYDKHGGYIRRTLRAAIRREGLPFKLEDLQHFIKTMQIGIGLKLLEGNKAEAEAATRFFLNLIKHVMEDRT